MASVTALTDLTVADLWKEVKDPETLWGDVSQQTLRTVKLLLENRMHDELVDYLNAGRYVRDPRRRRGYRNGGYRRRLVTTNLPSCDRIIYVVVHAFNLRQAKRPLSWETTHNP